MGMMVCLCVWFLVSISQAGEIDLLLQKLVDKGVLTGAEAQQVKIRNSGASKEKRLPGQFLFDAKLGCRILNEAILVKGRVENKKNLKTI